MQGMWAPSLLGLMLVLTAFGIKEFVGSYVIKRRKMLYALLAYKYAIDNPDVMVSPVHYIGKYSLEYEQEGQKFIEFYKSASEADTALHSLSDECKNAKRRLRSLQTEGLDEPLLFLSGRYPLDKGNLIRYKNL